MAELGKDAAEYHKQLFSLVNCSRIDCVHVVGDLYNEFWENLSPYQRGKRFNSPGEVLAALLPDIRSGDHLLIKGSNSADMHRIVSELIEMSERTN